jgi:centrosomal protein CEP76
MFIVHRDQKVIFWESLTGQRYAHDPSDPEHRLHPYKRIGCVFNDRAFYANKHPSDCKKYSMFYFTSLLLLSLCDHLSHFPLLRFPVTKGVETCIFELNHEGLWKSMDSKLIESLPHPPLITVLSPSTSSDSVADKVEASIRNMVVHRRRSVSLSTVFDDSLSYILSAALDSYENERLTGHAWGSEEFQQR